MHVVLVGAMGAGKTTIGRALATRLHRRFVDNDEQLRAATGHTPADVAANEGVDSLHRRETGELAEALDAPDAAVIAAAASTIADPSVRQRLRADAFVVWLRAEPDALTERTAGSAERPFSGRDVGAVIERQRAARDPLYRAAADLVVDTTATATAAAVDRITGALATWPGPASIR